MQQIKKYTQEIWIENVRKINKKHFRILKSMLYVKSLAPNLCIHVNIVHLYLLVSTNIYQYINFGSLSMLHAV